MLLHQPESQPAEPRTIHDGDLVIVYERHDSMKSTVVSAKGRYNNRFGSFQMTVSIALDPLCLCRRAVEDLHQSSHPFVELVPTVPDLWRVSKTAGLDWQAIWQPRHDAERRLGLPASANAGAVDAGAAPPHPDPLRG